MSKKNLRVATAITHAAIHGESRRRLLQWSAGFAMSGMACASASAEEPFDGAREDAGSTTAPLQFPRDLGAHTDYRTEWWYLTGHAASGDRHFGFQVTFFRSRVDSTQRLNSRLAARQLLFAHAAITDLHSGQLLHDQRIARWNGMPVATGQRRLPHASVDDTDVSIGDWSLRRVGDTYAAKVRAEGFALQLDCRQLPGQPILLQGNQGFSRKGPRPQQSSWYYSVPQLDVQGTLQVGSERYGLDPRSFSSAAPNSSGNDERQAPPPRDAGNWGKAWLDHEWSNELLDRDAAGWDWIGMNLFDGSALTVFRLRRADGSTLWTGGSFRSAGKSVQIFEPGKTRFTPGKQWISPRTRASYPVEWTIDTPSGPFKVRALLDDQELDSRASTGSVYWEGVSVLTGPDGTPVGRGYLEMTGYAGALKVS
jgi:predicted secreted hydrolase